MKTKKQLAKEAEQYQPASLVGITDDKRIWAIVRVAEARADMAEADVKHWQNHCDMRQRWLNDTREKLRKTEAELSVYRQRHGPIKII